MKGPRVIVALDHATDKEALALVDQLDPKLCRLKINVAMFTHYGPPLIAQLMQRGFTVFLDLKFHDIPQTVAAACRSAAELGVWMVNVHISGGKEMMMAAREAMQKAPAHQRPLLIGVTVLTSLNDQDLSEIGYQGSASELVLRMAALAQLSGLNGVVCSPQEIALLRQHLPKDFLLVTPGIRLPEEAKGDQKRVMSPQAALAAGADYIVIGRPITQSPQPQAVLAKITEKL